MKNKKYIIYIILGIIVIFNVYIYRAEIRILPEVNDNSFQFALVNEAGNLWQQIFSGKLSPFYLIDSFNNRWNEGLPLSTYYSHLPQAFISLVGLVTHIDTHAFFNIIKYLALVLLPLTFFAGARILDLSSTYALLTAFFSQSIFTDGLYGIDSTSFLWRGWGLSSQLFGVFFLPLAFAYAYRYINGGSEGGVGGGRGMGDMGKAVIFNFIVAQFHSGVFLMLVISYPLLVVYEFFKEKNNGVKQLLTLGGVLFIALAYFLIPFFTQGNYRSFSFWDPLWKFNSFGLKQTIIWFFNGAFFDFNRLPILTFLVLLGVVRGLRKMRGVVGKMALVFLVYSVLYLGRATWGRVIDIIPGMSEFHLHRFIVMMQFTGIFLASGLISDFIKKLDTVFFASIGTPLRTHRLLKSSKQVSTLFFIAIFIISAVIVYLMELPVVKYANENNNLIIQFNKQYEQEFPAYEKIVKKLRALPAGRVYAGRPGNWGRDFKVGGQQVYMAISQDGFATIGNSPESWSPNSEFDQFFDENNIDFYNLYNIRYLVAPAGFKPPVFAKLVTQSGNYYLYQVATTGWFDIGKSDMIIGGRKTDFLNIVHLWLTSDYLKNKNYPRIVFRKNPSFIINELWQQYPFTSRISAPVINMQEVQCAVPTSQSYCANFSLAKDCPNCIVILKNTYHPNWQVFVNKKQVSAFPIFPFFIGIPVEKAGDYSIIAVYKPNSLKILLIWAAIIMLLVCLVSSIKYLVWRRR